MAIEVQDGIGVRRLPHDRAEPSMIKIIMSLSGLPEKHDAGDSLRIITEAALPLITATDVEGVIGAGRHYCRWPCHLPLRPSRAPLGTWLGSLDLRPLKHRQGSHLLGFLQPRRTSEKALVADVQKTWIGGVSTLRVGELAQAMRPSGISKSKLSTLSKDIDERVGPFLNRLMFGEWPCLWHDASQLELRQGGHIINVAAIVPVAAGTDGRR